MHRRYRNSALRFAGAQCAPYARCILQNHPAAERPAGPSLCLRPNGRPGSAASASLPRWLCPFNRASAGVGILPDPQIRCPKDLLFTGHRSSSFAGVSENPPPRSCRRHHREGSPEPQVLVCFWLLFAQAKSDRGPGRAGPGQRIESINPRAVPARRFDEGEERTMKTALEKYRQELAAIKEAGTWKGEDRKSVV